MHLPVVSVIVYVPKGLCLWTTLYSCLFICITLQASSNMLHQICWTLRDHCRSLCITLPHAYVFFRCLTSSTVATQIEILRTPTYQVCFNILASCIYGWEWETRYNYRLSVSLKYERFASPVKSKRRHRDELYGAIRCPWRWDIYMPLTYIHSLFLFRCPLSNRFQLFWAEILLLVKWWIRNCPCLHSTPPNICNAGAYRKRSSHAKDL